METKTINRNNYSGQEVTATIIERTIHPIINEPGIIFEVNGRGFHLFGPDKTDRTFSLYEHNSELERIAVGYEFEDGQVIMTEAHGIGQRYGTGEDAALEAAIQLICNLY